ncbi:MAG TPA: sugar transferase [Sphingomonas sp.]|jgi:exopolysaccharide biosynthesis polyprenyl glycosylphosphotransferase
MRIRLCLAVAALDSFAMTMAFLVARLLKHTGDNWYAILAVGLPIYMGTALNAGGFSVQTLRRASASISRALQALLFTFATLFLISYFFRAEQDLSRLLLATTMGTSALLIIAFRYGVSAIVAKRWRGALTAEMVIRDGVHIDVTPPMRVVDAQRMGVVPDLRDPVMLNRFAGLVKGMDRVVIACAAESRKNWAMMLKGANVNGEVVVDDIAAIGAIGLSALDRHTTLTVSAGPLDMSQRIAKRSFDLALCIPALVALAPVLVITALAIKLDSRGPVFFKQRRIGRGNAFFEILKFRSMRVDMCDADGNQSTSRDDDRITRVGRFIRRTSMDELPQLLNVVGGSMSLVGPRPHALGSLAGEDLFWDVDERYWHRHVLKPGITGLAQVRGFRGATQHRDDLTRRLQADLEYAADWSIWRDVMILASTVRVVVHHNTY